MIRGPIFCSPSFGTQANTDAYFQPNPGGYYYPPNALILDAAGVSTGVRVSNVEYTAIPSDGSGFGTNATVTTFAAHGLNPGDVIKFTSGRWEVTVPNVAGTQFTQNIFGGVRLTNISLPYYSPTNPTLPATPTELCNQITNASPQKKENCQFLSDPIEINNVTPVNPFSTALLNVNQLRAGAGTSGAGTITGCAENCVAGQ